MGDFMREFWFPFVPSDALVAGGEPFPVRLLGEDLVAFRTEEGVPGLVGAYCAHRRAPMLYARNEGCGLRCVYHGWQYDVSGRCRDMPAEPETSRFKDHVSIPAYRCEERNGIVWAFMGTQDPPELPQFEWNLVDPANVYVSFRVQETDWLSAAEGELDSAHAPILHGRLDTTSKRSTTASATSGRPIFDVVQRDFGVSVGARRPKGDKLYWRINQFVFPFYTLVPPKSEEWAELTGHAWVPMDDRHTLCVMFTYLPDRPLKERMVDVFRDGYHGRETGHPSEAAFRTDVAHNVPYWRYWPKYDSANNFFFDYQLQETVHFSGLPGLWVQDSGTQIGASGSAGRETENLAASDAGIVVTRQTLLDVARAHASSGELPEGARNPEISRVRAASALLKPDELWAEALEEFVRAPIGAPLGYEIP